jgi:hypothetical protein
MYQPVQAYGDQNSAKFKAWIGLLTGDPASPILRILFMALILQPDLDDPILSGVRIAIVAQADDVILISLVHRLAAEFECSLLIGPSSPEFSLLKFLIWGLLQPQFSSTSSAAVQKSRRHHNRIWLSEAVYAPVLQLFAHVMTLINFDEEEATRTLPLVTIIASSNLGRIT